MTPATGSDRMGCSSALRVTFLTIVPSPYMLDLFGALDQDDRVRLQVLFMEMTAPDLPWGQVALPEYSSMLRGGWRNIGGGRVHWNPGVLSALRAARPDLVVVSGYSSLTTQVVMRWLRWRRIPWIFWGEFPGMRSLGGLRQRIRSWARYPAVTWPDAIAAIGSRAAVEYRRLAACEVANIPYYTDLSSFEPSPERGSGDGIRLLYCGQLIERKGVECLMEVVLQLANEIPGLTLTLLGDGPLRESLAQSVPGHLASRIVFEGFRPVAELPAFFRDADVFILPSRHDGWGVVVNQALGAGLPLICTDAVGAAHDLITDGWNGFMIGVDDRAALATAIKRLAAEPTMRQSFALHSRQRAAEWTPECGANRWVELIKTVLERQSDARPACSQSAKA